MFGIVPRHKTTTTSIMVALGVIAHFLFVFAIAVPPSKAGQKESEMHGGRSPHERFDDEHFKDGKHNEDMDHQAILGSKKVAEEYDHLSPDESKRRLRILARKIDKNGDSFVDRKELTDWIHHSLQMLDEEEINERFEEIDENKDDRISWEEYKADAFGEDEDLDQNGNPDPEDAKMMEEDKRYFAAADRNVDGFLFIDEFMAFQNPEHHDHMQSTLIDITLKEKDKNKDGVIDFKEFMGDISDKPDSEWYQLEKDRFEHDYDKNKDGHLNREEMKAWLIPDIQMTAKEEVDHLFAEGDHDKDDKLSYQEIVDEHQLFVGSEATNYGEHLENLKEEL